MRMLINIFFFFLMWFTVSGHETDQQTIDKNNILNDTDSSNKEFKDNLRKLDFAPIWDKDDVPYWGYLGFRGNNYQRLQIKFLDITKSNNDPDTYYVSGKTRIKDKINSFSGTIKILTANNLGPFSRTEWNVMKPDFENPYKYKELKGRGVIKAEYFFAEDNNQEDSGVFSGILSTSWYIDRKGKLQYDDRYIYSDSYCNNQFVGTWQAYNFGLKETCNWGHYRIPFSWGDLDIGAGEFSPADKYLQYGWQSYRDAYVYGNKQAIEIEKSKWWK